MTKVIQKIRELMGSISPTLNTNINYLVKKKRLPNLKNPVTFDEKITWLKLKDYPNNSLVSQCSDKLEVRSYIKSKGYSDILNELLGTWSNPYDIDLDLLPNEFVLKWNNDYNSTHVILDKSKTDMEKIQKELLVKGKEKFYLRASELHYKSIKPMIIAEKLLVEPGNDSLTDYKLYCYHSKVEFIMVCTGRGDNIKFYFFDRDWNLMRINKDGIAASEDFYLEKPKGLEEAIVIAEDLSGPFKFVRSDFYLIDGKVIFGELTFTPASGMDSNMSRDLDLFLGRKLFLGDKK